MWGRTLKQTSTAQHQASMPLKGIYCVVATEIDSFLSVAAVPSVAKRDSDLIGSSNVNLPSTNG